MYRGGNQGYRYSHGQHGRREDRIAHEDGYPTGASSDGLSKIEEIMIVVLEDAVYADQDPHKDHCAQQTAQLCRAFQVGCDNSEQSGIRKYGVGGVTVLSGYFPHTLLWSEPERTVLINVEPKNSPAANSNQRVGWIFTHPVMAIADLRGFSFSARVFSDFEENDCCNAPPLMAHSMLQSAAINPATVRIKATLGTST
jgi:hypothetical protein